jgi:2-dehydropantoate 2-reductase
MKFVIVGAGALGSIVAAHLARAGTPVALVARGRRADHIEAHGVRLTGLADFTAQVPVIRPGEREIDADVAILCVKTYDTEAALAPLRFTGRPVALSLQNGVLKNEELAQRFGADRVLGAAASVSGELLADGSTSFTMNQRLPVGAGPPSAPRINGAERRGIPGPSPSPRSSGPSTPASCRCSPRRC